MKDRANDHSKYKDWINPEETQPYPLNSKLHTDRQIRNIANSIRRFGWQQDTVLTSDNVLVIGHGRRLAAIQLGCQMPYHRIDKKADELTDKDIRELRHADNLTNSETGYDFELQQEDIEDLDFDGFDFDFDLPEEEEPIEITEDDYDKPLPDEPKSKLGDIYQLGRHRLICGDSTDHAVIDRLMDGVKADMVFTDPPYGYNYQSNMRTKSEKFDALKNDNEILDFFQCIKDIAIGFVYVCATWKTADKWIELFKKYYDLTNVIIWDKGGGGIGDLFHTFATDYEMILVCNNGQELRGKRYGSVWNFTDTEISKMKKEELLKIVLEQKEYYSIWKQKKDNPNEYVHPTQKPVALSARAIRSSTDFDGVVLDCFGGSGSTLIACEQLNRKCYMCELDQRYVDVIIDRWETFTGEKAVLLNEQERDG